MMPPDYEPGWYLATVNGEPGRHVHADIKVERVAFEGLS